MSTSTPGETSRVRPEFDVPSATGSALLLVIAGQLADSLTTLYGLRTDGVYERNPIVAHVLQELGPMLGLLVSNLLALGLLVLGVELGARWCRERGTSSLRIRQLRVGCYLVFALASFAAAANNLHVLAAA